MTLHYKGCIMKRFRIIPLFGALSLLASSRLTAQATPGAPRSATPSATASATVAADPKDVASADAIIAALYDANTIMADQKRDVDRFRSLFVPGARLMPTSRRANGPAVIRIMTVDDYVGMASGGQPRHGFSEREIARKSDAFGNIMQVFSTYETHRDSTDTHPVHGINSIQLFNDGTRWWVVSIF